MTPQKTAEQEWEEHLRREGAEVKEMTTHDNELHHVELLCSDAEGEFRVRGDSYYNALRMATSLASQRRQARG